MMERLAALTGSAVERVARSVYAAAAAAFGTFAFVGAGVGRVCAGKRRRWASERVQPIDNYEPWTPRVQIRGGDKTVAI